MMAGHRRPTEQEEPATESPADSAATYGRRIRHAAATHRPLGPSPPKRPGSSAAAAAQVLNQQAVAEALGSDVPPRDAAERVTFATWAIVTGKSPGGIFNALPTLDDETAEKMAQRLSERAEGTITAEDVKTAPTIEALATGRARASRGR